jgi:hypothetical protein
LTSDFFLNEKKFLHGIDGRPNQERMSHFGEALTRARELAKMRQKTNPNDGEALFALTLAAGMESDGESILQKKHMNGLKRMKEANKYAECLLAKHPDATDAYIALGIANYIIGSQSAGSRFALGLDDSNANVADGGIRKGTRSDEIRPIIGPWPLPPLRPKRAASGVAGLRYGSSQHKTNHALMSETSAGKPRTSAQSHST